MTKAERERICSRYLMSTEPEKARQVIKMFRPTLKSPKLVPEIYRSVQTDFSEDSEDIKRDVFIAATIQLYNPLGFMFSEDEIDHKKKAQGKLPAGVRDEVAKPLGFVNSEMVNHHKRFIEPFMDPFNSGPERPFKAKVMSIVERFKCYSINASDTQYQLSL